MSAAESHVTPPSPGHGGRGGRRVGTSESREDIAAAARRLFAARGYGAVPVRVIAAEAGVDPALIYHFFGSKKGLLDELMALPFDPEEVVRQALAGGIDALGEHIVRFILTQLRDPVAGEKIVAVLRTAAAQPDAAAALREFYSRRLLEPLALSLHIDRPRLRAALCSSQLIGLAMAEHVIGIDPLVRAPTEDLIGIYADTVQRYLTEPLPGPR